MTACQAPLKGLEITRRWVQLCCNRYPDMWFIIGICPGTSSCIHWTQCEWECMVEEQRRKRKPLEMWLTGTRYEYDESLLELTDEETHVDL